MSITGEEKRLKFAVFFIAGWMAIEALVAPVMIGKQRKPVTPGLAAGVFVVAAVFTVVLVLAGMRLR